MLRDDYEKLLLQAERLLESGDDTGCDGLVVVGEKEFHALRKLVHELTGVWEGSVDEYIEDKDTGQAPSEEPT